jgi:hypothetical protein
LKIFPSNFQTKPSVKAVIVAVLTASYRRATSPKASPSSKILTFEDVKSVLL